MGAEIIIIIIFFGGMGFFFIACILSCGRFLFGNNSSPKTDGRNYHKYVRHNGGYPFHHINIHAPLGSDFQFWDSSNNVGSDNSVWSSSGNDASFRGCDSVGGGFDSSAGGDNGQGYNIGGCDTNTESTIECRCDMG